VPQQARILTTVLFLDIVGSTDIAGEIGDERWHELLRRFRGQVRSALRRFGGREVDTAGDGFLARFDSPASAVRAATTIAADVQALGIEIRAGVHFGECVLQGGGLSGVAVHTGARAMAVAGPGEVLVTTTVRDLIGGARVSLPTAAGTR
jgi:class 3 adenylate cyclase